jgi:hypothetical protein
MVAVPRTPAVEQLQWLAPAPLWNTLTVGPASSGLTQPWIAELRSDSFVSDFLGLVGGQNGASPDGLASTVPHLTAGGVPGAPFRLFQPMSQCYYLVSATLVCRRPGIPDRAVKPARGERTSFVIRLLTADGEQAWVPAGGHGSATAPDPGSPPSGQWQQATAGALVDGEEQFPMHAAPVAAFADAGTTAATLGMATGTDSTRTVFYGYIPVGRRERMVPALPDPVTTFNNYQPPAGVASENPWVDELIARVVQPWQDLTKINKSNTWPNGAPASYPHYTSLYLLLDLADWLQKYLPDVYRAITGGPVPTGPQGDLYNFLSSTSPQVEVLVNNSPTPISTALAGLKNFTGLVTGEDIEGPTDQYDLSQPSPPGPFTDLINHALAAVQAAPAPTLPPELQGMIKLDPVAPPDGWTDPTYVIRAVFEHDPCQPVLSEASYQFELARAVDPDAPARKIRIQLPDVANMRKYQRGVALEMPSSLRSVINRVTPDVLKGQGLSDGGVQLGMICSFSLQIIFICAFILLFVILLVLNFVFWWLPFLKICFPIPVDPAKPNAPQP